MELKLLLKKLMILLYRPMNVLLRVKPHRILFMSNMGKNCTGNPRAVYEELLKDSRYDEYEPVWVLTRQAVGQGCCVPGMAKTVTYGGLKYYVMLATAGIRVFDTRQEPYVIKRPETMYVQTWHGTPLKKLGLDIEEFSMAGEKDREDYYRRIREEASKWDLLISPNAYSSGIFRSCFGYTGEILECGYPRNDSLARAAAGEKGRKAAGNPESAATEGPERTASGQKRILLYAPTWRDDEYCGDGWYRFSTGLDLKLLEELLGDRYEIWVKPHYLVKLRPGDIHAECLESGFVKLCGQNDDIAKLYLRSDALITDYSSVMFDYAVLGRPMFFFVYDYERYSQEIRGFYFDPATVLPGPMSGNTEQLAADILNYYDGDGDVYAERYEDFRKCFTPHEDGHAAARVLERITSGNGN